MRKPWVCMWRRRHEMSVERVKPDSSSSEAAKVSLVFFDVVRDIMGGDIAVNLCGVCGYIEREPDKPDAYRRYLILSNGTAKPTSEDLDDRYEASNRRDPISSRFDSSHGTSRERPT